MVRLLQRLFRAAEPAVQSDQKPATLAQVIHPAARDRWLGPVLSTYTPAYVETVIRGAVSGDLLDQWQLFDLMEATWPRLNKNLNELKDAVTGLDWSVQSWSPKGGKPSPEAAKRAAMIDELLWSMEPDLLSGENGFEDTIWDIMDARGKGIAVLEIDWHRRETSTGTAIAPRATRWVHPRHYGYDSRADVPDRLRLRASEISNLKSQIADQWLEFPANKFVVGICKSKSGHPISGPILRVLGFWWAAANFSAEWFLNFAQIFGQPIRWANYDPSLNRADRQTLEDMLAGMGSNAWALFPAGTTLELKEASRGGTDNPQVAVLERADKICDLLILRQTLTSDVGDSGSLALGAEHAEVLSGVKQGLSNWVARTLNQQFIKPICLLNYGDTDECPYLIPSAPERHDPKAAAERDEILSRMGVAIPKAWFYERHEVPMPAEGEEVLEKLQPPPMIPGQGTGTPPRPEDAEDPEDEPSNPERRLDDINAKAADVAADAIAPLVRQAVARVVGARDRWLAPVQEELDRLVAALRDQTMDNATLTRFAEATGQNLPDLFAKMDINALADALEDSLGAATMAGLRDGTRR